MNTSDNVYMYTHREVLGTVCPKCDCRSVVRMRAVILREDGVTMARAPMLVCTLCRYKEEEKA